MNMITNPMIQMTHVIGTPSIEVLKSIRVRLLGMLDVKRGRDSKLQYDAKQGCYPTFPAFSYSSLGRILSTNIFNFNPFLFSLTMMWSPLSFYSPSHVDK